MDKPDKSDSTDKPDTTEQGHPAKCLSCGEPIDISKKASITSWIFAENVCKCAKPKRAQSKSSAPRAKRVITFPGFTSCSRCGMLRRPMREGSLTAWMMGPITCECADIEIAPDERSADLLAEVGAEPPDALTNITIDQRYCIMEKIGSGGMSAIYRAHDLKLGKQVALKFLLGHQLIDEQVARFQQEASVVAKMNHPNIIRIYDFGVFNSTPYMVLQLVEGPTVTEVLRQDGPFSIDEAVPILEQICDGMLHAHKLGIVHRDLKADNVMLCGLDNEIPLILDFGICKWEQAALTHVGDQIGSPIYMSPEQRQGTSVDSRTDVYSMGCLIFEMLSGRPLFTMDDFINRNKPQLSVLERLPGESPGAIDAMIRTIARCLRTDPANRFQTISELREALVDRSAPGATKPAATGKSFLNLPLSRPATVVLIVVLISISSFGLAMYIKSGRTSMESSKSAAKDSKNEAKADSSVARKKEISSEQPNSLSQNVPTPSEEEMNKKSSFSKSDKVNAPVAKVSTEGVMIFVHPTVEFIKGEFAYRGRPTRLMLELAPAGILSSLPHLTLDRLYVSLSQLSRADWKTVEAAQSINTFDLLQKGGVGDKEFASILKLKELTTLGLCGGPISGRGLAQLNQLPNLRILILEYNRAVKDDSIARLAKLYSLEQLWVSHTNIGDKGVASLAALPNLRFIDLSNNALLTDKAIDALEGMPRLEEVRIVGCEKLTQKRIAALMNERRNLRVVNTEDEEPKKVSEQPKVEWYFGVVDLRNSTKFVQRSENKWQSRDPKKDDFRALKGKNVDNIVMWFAKPDTVAELTRLPVVSLAIGHCDFKLDDYEQIAKMRTLRQFSVGSSRFSDDELRAIASMHQLRKLAIKSIEADSFLNLEPLSNLKDLVSLDLSDNVNLDDGSLEAVIPKLTKLEELYLSNTRITSKALTSIAKIHSLKTLDVSINKNISDDGLQYLLKARNLRLLHCYSCPGITPGGQRMLQSLLPKLRISMARPDYSKNDLAQLRQVEMFMREGVKESAHLVPKFLGGN